MRVFAFDLRSCMGPAINAIEDNDAFTRGIVALGLDASEAELAASFENAARFDLVRGFAVGGRSSVRLPVIG